MSWCGRGGEGKMSGSQFFFLQCSVLRDHTQVARLVGRHPTILPELFAGTLRTQFFNLINYSTLIISLKLYVSVEDHKFSL